jgi:hypothetical protein
MTVISLSILTAPFVVAVALGWVTHRSDGLRPGLRDSSDAVRMQHELEAIRTRFERQPGLASGAVGERR